jgi:RND superfamily putative drug exporter
VIVGFLSRWAVLNPKRAIGIWLLLMAIVFGLAWQLKAEFNDSFSLPNTPSTQAQEILAKDFPSQADTNTSSATIVFGVKEGSIASKANVAKINAVLAEVRKNKSIISATSPFEAPAGQAEAPQSRQAGSTGPTKAAPGGAPTGFNPAGTAGAFLSPVSKDGTVAKADVVVKTNDGEANKEDLKSVFATIKKANTASLEVGVSGRVFDFVGGDPPKSAEAIGIAVALVIMALMFGAVVAAGLPIITAVFGLATGLAAVTLFTGFADIPTFAPTLASLIGLGVGIDYSLFVINRFKVAIDSGREPRAAAIESVNTSGRAVLFAGTTVIVALAGLFVLGIGFVNGLAIASMLTVLFVMLSALWLLPALISQFGRKTFALKLPWARTVKVHPKGTLFARYGQWIQGRSILLVVGSLVAMVVIAIPTLSLQQGFADAGGKKPGTPSRIGYDLLARGFGSGIGSPYIVVATLPKAGDLTSAAKLATALQKADGVAGATNAVPNDVKNPNKATSVIYTVFPDSSPQSEETAKLLDTLRDDAIPAVEQKTGIKAYVGGAKATVTDFGSVLSDALPLFLVIVIGLGIVALGILFRSILVPVIGALASLLSFGAALGVSVAIFQWGWFKDAFGIEATGPIAPFVPVFLFAILFGLSMDYQVFLVSRMQEEWAHSKDHARSIRRGMAGSGRVVAAAAAIMASVFFGFVLGDDATIKLFGLSLGVAVLLDAFVVRLILVPSLMSLIGQSVWWLPAWLDRLIPHLVIETEEEFEAESALIEDVPVR